MNYEFGDVLLVDCYFERSFSSQFFAKFNGFGIPGHCYNPITGLIQVVVEDYDVIYFSKEGLLTGPLLPREGNGLVALTYEDEKPVSLKVMATDVEVGDYLFSISRDAVRGKGLFEGLEGASTFPTISYFQPIDSGLTRPVYSS